MFEDRLELGAGRRARCMTVRESLIKIEGGRIILRELGCTASSKHPEAIGHNLLSVIRPWYRDSKAERLDRVSSTHGDALTLRSLWRAIVDKNRRRTNYTERVGLYGI